MLLNNTTNLQTSYSMMRNICGILWLYHTDLQCTGGTGLNPMDASNYLQTKQVTQQTTIGIKKTACLPWAPWKQAVKQTKIACTACTLCIQQLSKEQSNQLTREIQAATKRGKLNLYLLQEHEESINEVWSLDGFGHVRDLGSGCKVQPQTMCSLSFTPGKMCERHLLNSVWLIHYQPRNHSFHSRLVPQSGVPLGLGVLWGMMPWCQRTWNEYIAWVYSDTGLNQWTVYSFWPNT